MKEPEDGEAGPRLRVGVSACLLGQEVRYDGGHKRDRWITDVLGRHVDFVPVCPEVEIGLGTPRETIRLERRRGALRLVAPASGADHTEKMRAYAEERTAALELQSLCGYVLKKDSPSCGMERVRVYDATAAPSRQGRGLFAAALLRRLPALPVEDEGRLNDARLRENFVTRLFAYDRWLQMVRSGITRAKLFRYHARHKYVLMAHSQAGMSRLGHMLASAPSGANVTRLASRYLEEFTAAMQRVPTPKSHTNVLQHLAGYVSKELDPGDRAELTGTIEEYRLGRLPLVVPVTLLRHHVRRLEVPYVGEQVYMSPHPAEMMLLNHV